MAILNDKSKQVITNFRIIRVNAQSIEFEGGLEIFLSNDEINSVNSDVDSKYEFLNKKKDHNE